jgi:hypothetical protein
LLLTWHGPTGPSKEDIMSRLRTTLLAATLLAGVGGIAAAQMSTPAPGAATPSTTVAAPAYDPQQLPATKGRVA